jgi:hypothetical protein
MSVMLSVKVTRHRTIWLFFLFYFSTAIPSIYTKRIFLLVLLIDIGMKNSVSKGHRNIPIKKFY